MVNLIFGYDPFGLIVIVTAGVEISGKSWEVATGDLDSDGMPFREIVACRHGGYF